MPGKSKSSKQVPHNKRNEKLLSWLNGLPRHTQETLATNIGTTIGQLRQIAYGHRNCSARLAVELDRLTGGGVSMIEMAPDLNWEHIRLFVHSR